jgi:hypothetical protein
MDVLYGSPYQYFCVRTQLPYCPLKYNILSIKNGKDILPIDR